MLLFIEIVYMKKIDLNNNTLGPICTFELGQKLYSFEEDIIY